MRTKRSPTSWCVRALTSLRYLVKSSDVWCPCRNVVASIITGNELSFTYIFAAWTAAMAAKRFPSTRRPAVPYPLYRDMIPSPGKCSVTGVAMVYPLFQQKKNDRNFSSRFEIAGVWKSTVEAHPSLKKTIVTFKFRSSLDQLAAPPPCGSWVSSGLEIVR